MTDAQKIAKQNCLYRRYQVGALKFTLTPTRLFLLGLLALFAVVVFIRLLTGFSYVTNLSDETPWGLWISFDVMTGVALAGGGYSTAFLVHGIHKEKFKVVARSALLTSLLGYLLVMGGLLLDVGQWIHAWAPMVSWGYTSVLFEVFFCISIYTTILCLEFTEIITEKFFKIFHPLIKFVMPVLVILGLIFPMMHQSSLGGLFLLFKSKMFPLWWSELLPLYFLMSSFFVGSAMVCVESDFARRAYGHAIDEKVMSDLLKIGGYVMIVYLLLKIGDITLHNQWNLLFLGTMQSNLYCLEMLFGILIPLAILFVKPIQNLLRDHFKVSPFLVYGWLTVLGVVFNRLNCVFTSMYKTGAYFPSIGEFIVSIGLVAAGVLVYCFVVENFNILGNHEATPVKFDKDEVRVIGRVR